MRKPAIGPQLSQQTMVIPIDSNQALHSKFSSGHLKGARSMPTLTSLAKELLDRAKQIDEYLGSKKLPSPSFDNDVFSELPAELQDVRASLASLSNNLKSLTRGPVGSTSDIIFSVSRQVALYALDKNNSSY